MLVILPQQLSVQFVKLPFLNQKHRNPENDINIRESYCIDKLHGKFLLKLLFTQYQNILPWLSNIDSTNWYTSTIIMKHISLPKIDDSILNLHEDCERTLAELRLHLHYLFKLYKNNYQNYNLASRLSYFPFKMSTGCLASLPFFHPRP